MRLSAKAPGVMFALLCVTVLLLAACTQPTPVRKSAPATNATAIRRTPTRVRPSPTAPKVPTLRVMPTQQPVELQEDTPTPVPETSTPLPATATSEPEIALPAATEGPTVAPTVVPAATAAPAAPPAVAVVKAPVLNLRAAPATDSAVIGRLTAGDELNVRGQSEACAWLKVQAMNGLEGWVAAGTSGGALVTMNASCDAVPLAEGGVPAPSTEACYLIQNQTSAEVTLILTAKDRDWGATFSVPAGHEKTYCLPAGSYAYVINAPAPYSAVSGDLTAKPGGRVRWPIVGQQ